MPWVFPFLLHLVFGLVLKLVGFQVSPICFVEAEEEEQRAYGEEYFTEQVDHAELFHAANPSNIRV